MKKGPVIDYDIDFDGSYIEGILFCDQLCRNDDRNRALRAISDLSFEEKMAVTGITDRYYLNKILTKKIPMSGYVFYKIIPDVSETVNENYHYCAHCGITAISKRSLYCEKCESKVTLSLLEKSRKKKVS